MWFDAWHIPHIVTNYQTALPFQALLQFLNCVPIVPHFFNFLPSHAQGESEDAETAHS
jgi:hypothetical protein